MCVPMYVHHLPSFFPFLFHTHMYLMHFSMNRLYDPKTVTRTRLRERAQEGITNWSESTEVRSARTRASV